MPANSERGVAARRREILGLLPIAPASGKTAREIHQALEDRGFKAVKRTVERDLEALSAELDCDPSEPDGWRWRRSRRFRRDEADDGIIDAVNLRLIETSLRPLMPAGVLRVLEPRLKAAAESLDGLRSRNAVSDWPNKVASELPMVPFVPPEIDQRVLEEVQYALIHDYVITCEYRSVATRRYKKMKLHPLGMVQRGPVTYLIATVGVQSGPRSFALHRMRNIQQTIDTLQRPVGFSLKQFLADGGMQFGDCKPIRLVARVSPTLAAVIDEAKLDRNQTLSAEEDGWFRLEATVQNTWQLQWWILSKLEEFEVVEPRNLRDKIENILRNALLRYSSSNH